MKNGGAELSEKQKACSGFGRRFIASENSRQFRVRGAGVVQ